MSKAIKVENLTKEFVLDHFRHHTLREKLISSFRGRREVFRALNDVSFEINQGEFLGIIGNNGSGKSTLLKILANIYVPTAGSVTINGKLSPFLELGVGFQPELSAWENIFLYGTLLGMSEKQIREKIDDIIAFSELEKFIDTKLNKFSSGMLVRLAFATAIQADFDILLLDEVLAVGDYGFQRKCQQIFAKLKTVGKTIVFVSHDLEAVKQYCDRVLVLADGQLARSGLAAEICDYYINEVAQKQQAAHRALIKKMTTEQPVARVGSTKLLAPADKEQIKPGETIRIEVLVEFLQKITGPVVGLEIRNRHYQVVFATNTARHNINFETTAGRQKIIFTIDQWLSPGHYFVSPAICDQDKQVFFDWKDDDLSFVVIGGNNGDGICCFNHKIKIINEL
ncbi:MAG: ABC transporter ATP-binding protein [Patescibacteria group bacterium]